MTTIERDDTPLPGTTTLAEARRFFLEGDIAMHLDAITAKHGKYPRLRFLTTPEMQELPDSMTLEEFRHLANQQKAAIVIDDGQGGAPALPKMPELV